MKALLIALAVVSLAVVAVLSRSVFALEKPAYTLVSKAGSLEVRTYEPVTVATTPLEGEYRASTRGGFRVIANYIFGGNGASEKIAMTAPVLVENPAAAEYSMAFVMPSASVESGLPAPMTDALELKQQDWGTVAVWSFGGWATEERLASEWGKMQAALQEQDIKAGQYDWIAQYSPPSLPPPLRHNEIWVLLDGAG